MHKKSVPLNDTHEILKYILLFRYDKDDFELNVRLTNTSHHPDSPYEQNDIFVLFV